MVPKKLFFTKGVGKHKERLTSFELALRDAGIASQNLVRVSSIFPPQCKMLARKEGLKYLHPGEVVFRCRCSEPRAHLRFRGTRCNGKWGRTGCEQQQGDGRQPNGRWQ